MSIVVVLDLDKYGAGPVVRKILAAGREMLSHPVETLPGAKAARIQP